MDNDCDVIPEIRAAKYSAKNYNFSKEFLSEISTLESHKTLCAIFTIWAAVALLVVFMKFLAPTPWFWWAYLPVALLIAGRQGALLQIVHEGAHNLIVKNKMWNDLIGNWLAAYPTGLTVLGYGKSHLQHHAHTNTPNDLPTDIEKYSTTDLNDRNLARVFLRDLFGLTALGSFFGHSANSVRTENTESRAKKLKDRAGQGTTQLILLATIFQFHIGMYLLLWAIPLISFNMVLLRIRGIAEHGLPNQIGKTIHTVDQGRLYTRTMIRSNRTAGDYVLNLLERILIGSLNCNYHHEHHILPTVPFYKLPKIHDWIYPELSKSHPIAFAKGYMHAFLTRPTEKMAHGA
jgi:fatty acid desaturase